MVELLTREDEIQEKPTLPASYVELQECMETARASLANKGIEPSAPAGEALLAVYAKNFIITHDLPIVPLHPENVALLETPVPAKLN